MAASDRAGGPGRGSGLSGEKTSETAPMARAEDFGQEVMNCRELLEQLNQYVDGDIDPALCEEIERHLADCDPCQVMVDTLPKTI
ncbi:MAG: zf-HC2 domain-containing protein, partial [Verrucomicrobia bacterium]|nr:zf-HC2 domain-containing protein [Verrucomicrobiota bacterium]